MYPTVLAVLLVVMIIISTGALVVAILIRQKADARDLVFSQMHADAALRGKPIRLRTTRMMNALWVMAVLPLITLCVPIPPINQPLVFELAVIDVLILVPMVLVLRMEYIRADDERRARGARATCPGYDVRTPR